MQTKIVTSKGFVMFATVGFPSKTAECQSLLDWLNDVDIPRTPKAATKKHPINGQASGYFVFTPYRQLPQIRR